MKLVGYLFRSLYQSIRDRLTFPRKIKYRTTVRKIGKYRNNRWPLHALTRNVRWNVCNEIQAAHIQSTVQYVVLGPRNSAIPLVRVFSENDKILRQEKNTLNNERHRDLLISILSYDEVSAFLLWLKTRGEDAKLKFVDG